MKLAEAVATLKQAYKQKKELCFVKKTKEISRLLTVLNDMGVINGSVLNRNHICVFLRYKNNVLSLRKIGLFSKPSYRVFLKRGQLRGNKVFGYYYEAGSFIMRNSYSFYWLTDVECALLGVGGEPVLALG